mmetsp:Transcript_21908/g.55160  ORF Transcript_21908/g.55160 Transcript_21908/m.55160 type:complete len:202 (+) Transcript_21908:375-980(+)
MADQISRRCLLRRPAGAERCRRSALRRLLGARSLSVGPARELWRAPGTRSYRRRFSTVHDSAASETWSNRRRPLCGGTGNLRGRRSLVDGGARFARAASGPGGAGRLAAAGAAGAEQRGAHCRVALVAGHASGARLADDAAGRRDHWLGLLFAETARPACAGLLRHADATERRGARLGQQQAVPQARLHLGLARVADGARG